jgi:uncharacterized protein YaiE (UPF0345 family)
MKKLNLQQFAGGHSVTVYKDSHVTTATPSSDSDVQKDAEVTLTLEFGTGYELDEIEVVTGGVKVELDDETWGFTMGEADVVLNVKSKKNNAYIVTENTWVWVNGSGTELKRNMKIEKGANGEIFAVTSTPTALSISADVIASLVKQGVLVKV